MAWQSGRGFSGGWWPWDCGGRDRLIDSKMAGKPIGGQGFPYPAHMPYGIVWLGEVPEHLGVQQLERFPGLAATAFLLDVGSQLHGGV